MTDFCTSSMKQACFCATKSYESLNDRKVLPVSCRRMVRRLLSSRVALESEGKNSEDRVLGPRYLDKWDDAVSRVLCHQGKLLQPVCGVNLIIREVKGGNREI